jgi:glucoamylase
MSEQPLYRWLEQQGEAFGAPGLPPRWTSAVKDAIGTAYSASSRMWFTCSHGIVNEIYHPSIDKPQVRDFEFLVTDGASFVHEEKRDLISEFDYIHPEAMGVRYTNRDPDGRYTLTKEIICDPHHSVLLVNVRIEGHHDLVPRLKVYALLAPHLNGGGAGNSGRVADVAGYKMLAAFKDDWSLAMGATCGFSRVSCGFVGTSDGWRDLKENFRMDWEYGSATNGNIALFGELDLGAAGVDGARAFTLAIGIGDTMHASLQKTLSGLVMPYEQNRARYIEQWKRAANPEWLAQKAQDGGRLMRASHNVLLAHEDKKYSGAFVASASIPWGQAKGDDDLGGYHLVWTRDMVQTAGALLACGRAETARRALVYLACTQEPDGGFAQNFWVDGRPYWSGMQLDEVAFPVILAWRLWKANGLGEMNVIPFVERAAGFLVRHAPITQQERWEENSGYSPSTLTVVISALVCAGEILRAHDADELALFFEEYADWIEGHLEDWTVTNDGVLVKDGEGDDEGGVKRHYMRIRPPENFAAGAAAYDSPGDGTERIHLNNRPPGTPDSFEAREIIDAGFLELVRYGVRRADSPLMADSIKVVDAVLKRDLPQGPGWLRYNWDGYGNGADGKAFTGYGQGRVWPLLTGERAHYELAAGNDITPLIKAYEGFATCGQMMPEQVWDAEDIPRRGLRLGGPAGSATPLVWAHAEYLKLLRSAHDGKVFDRVDPVYERYCTDSGPRPQRNLEIFTFRRPIARIVIDQGIAQETGEGAGKTPRIPVLRIPVLRIIDERSFEASWSTDNWKTVHTGVSVHRGSSGYSLDIPADAGPDGSPEGGKIAWTLRWSDSGTGSDGGSGQWLGYNVEVAIVSSNPSD